MNFNILAYLIYLPITTIITLWVGYILYKNGEPFILKQFNNDRETTLLINRILLVGYYLINLGYCFWIVSQWKTLDSVKIMLNSLSETIGIIVLGLGLMHYLNILVLSIIGKREKQTA